MAVFTTENARIMAAKSHEARRIAEEAKEKLFVDATIAAAKIPDLPSYVAERLARVRMQLDRIDDMLLTEKDPAKLDRLASAQSRLDDQERSLSGRPLPGTLRPAPEKNKSSSPKVD